MLFHIKSGLSVKFDDRQYRFRQILFASSGVVLSVRPFSIVQMKRTYHKVQLNVRMSQQTWKRSHSSSTNKNFTKSVYFGICYSLNSIFLFIGNQDEIYCFLNAVHKLLKTLLHVCNTKFAMNFKHHEKNAQITKSMVQTAM